MGRCRFMVNTDVSITLYTAVKRGLAHPLLAWFKRRGGEVCYSELLRDELRDMERRGRLCPGDAQRILDTLRRYGAREEPARVGRAKRAALRLLFDGELPGRMLNDAKLAYHAASLRARLASYNERDYERLRRHIRGLVYIRPPGAPLAYTCSKGGQAGAGVQGRGRQRSRQASEAGEATRRPKGEGDSDSRGRALQAKRGRGGSQAEKPSRRRQGVTRGSHPRRGRKGKGGARR